MNTNSARNALVTGLEIVVTGAMLVLVARTVFGPDALRTLNMRVARSVSHTAKRQAEWWTTLAARSDTAYHRMTL